MTDERAGSRDERLTIQTVSLLVLAAVAVAVALIYTRAVMVPFLLSVLLSYLLRPLIDRLQDRLRLPRWLAVVAVILGVLGLLGGLSMVIASSIAKMTSNAAVYQQQLVTLVQRLAAWLDGYGVDLGQWDIMAAVSDLPLLDWIKRTAGGMVGFVANFFLVTVFLLYLVAGRRAAPAGEAADLERKIRSYLMTKIALSAVTGVLVGSILLALGVDLALVFGLLAFLLNFIPNIGSMVATLLPLPVVLMQFDSPLLVVLAILLPGAVQMVIGNVVEPRLLGRSLGLHPITILLSLVFWGLLWGVVGMLLATPLTVVLRIQLERFAVTRPVARLMGSEADEPA